MAHACLPPSQHGTLSKTAPKVYYVPDAQGRMASYYSALDLPEDYTSRHNIPQTSHFVPVDYCCLDELFPRQGGHQGNKTRQPQIQIKQMPATQPGIPLPPIETPAVRAYTEPRAPPSSPESPKMTKNMQTSAAPVPAAVIALDVQLPLSSTTPQAQHQLQQQALRTQQLQQPLQPQQPILNHQASSLANCTECVQPAQPALPQHCYHSTSFHPPPAPVLAHATVVAPLPMPPAICRRWLIGTCRRGVNCRNRHQILHETDDELMKIKEGHLATIQFYNQAAGIGNNDDRETGSREPVRRLGIDASAQKGTYVEAFVDELGKIQIPLAALTEKLNGVKVEEKRDLMDMPVTMYPVNEPQLKIASHRSTSDAEPIPDYRVSMPPVHPAELLRASYARPKSPIDAPRGPQYLGHPRRYPRQEFIPRHVLDKALRQYISSFRGRRSYAGGRAIGPCSKKGDVLEEMKRQGSEKGEMITIANSMKTYYEANKIDVSIATEDGEATVAMAINQKSIEAKHDPGIEG